jgi:hypothetical protein
LSAALERLLDEHDRPGERIRLDRIEIDLGVCDPEEWEAALVVGIERALAARLRTAINEIIDAAQGEPALSALSLLSEFARSGRLPWWGGRADTPSATVRALARTGVEAAQVRRLLSLPGAIERLVFQLGDTDLVTLAELAGVPGVEARQIFDDGGSESIERKAKTVALAGRTTYWVALLRRVADGRLLADDTAVPPASPVRARSSETTRLLPETPARLSRATDQASHEEPLAQPQATIEDGRATPNPDDGIDLVAFLARIAGRYPAWEMVARESMLLVRTLDPIVRATVTRAIADAAGDDNKALQAVVTALASLGVVEPGQADDWRDAIDRSRAALPTPTEAAQTKPAVTKPMARSVEETHDAIAIDDGGLPLVWPFLPRFFSYSGLVTDDAFLSEAARHRAATLLFHLATGERVADETRLMLPKLLVGLDLDAVHKPGEPLADNEVAAAEDVLSALIGHAPMLGRISVEGLRSAYLQRPGSLTTRDGHWLLRVERKSYDLLLDRLPWSFGWVKLPWMAAPLQVEW